MNTELFTPPAIVGEIESGKSAKALKQVKDLIKTLNGSTFDLMDALYNVKTAKYYAPKYNTYTEYAMSLDLKSTKAYYLPKIKETMLIVGVPREEYESVGIAKLRVITSIEMRDGEGEVIPSSYENVKTLLAAAKTKTLTEIKADVEVAKGNVGEDAWEWLNIRLRKAAKAIVRKMFDGVKLQMGSSGKDAEGNSLDPSDGSALEMVAMDWHADENNAAVIQLLDKQDAVTEVLPSE